MTKVTFNVEKFSAAKWDIAGTCCSSLPSPIPCRVIEGGLMKGVGGGVSAGYGGDGFFLPDESVVSRPLQLL